MNTHIPGESTEVGGIIAPLVLALLAAFFGLGVWAVVALVTAVVTL